MSSKMITDKPESRPAPGEWKPFQEAAPSVMREDVPTLSRVLGIIGLFLLGLAVIAMVMRISGVRSGWIGPGLGVLFSVVGLILMMLHAAADKEQQVRRLYGAFGCLWLVVGIVLPFIPVAGVVGTLFGPGLIAQMIALLFLLAFLRNETDTNLRDLTIKALGAIGGVQALVAFIWGNVQADFVPGLGIVLALLGLAYLWSFVAVRGIGDNLGYRVGLALGVLGVLVFVVALGRSVFAPRSAPYFIPSGLMLMLLGLLYAGFAAALVSDYRVVVLARRELAAFFYSPIAYIVLFGLTVVGAFLFANFIFHVFNPDPRSGPMIEPIVRNYIVQWWPIISVIFVVPVLTMRLLSEERRTGTLEVLLTAPVDETSVVLSKFLAALVFYTMIWVPWGLFLVALRIEGGQPFDYRPLLSFFVALITTGAGFLSMGLFFSSLTRNQIAGAVLTFAGMLGLTMVFFAKMLVEAFVSPTSPWITVLRHMSFIDLWIETLDGILVLKYVVFHVSAAILWLFLTAKVLEARRWS